MGERPGSEVFTLPRLDPEHLDAAMDTLRLLGDPTRFQILWALSAREGTVGELAELTGAAMPAVSQHLAKLRVAGVVGTRRYRNHVVYNLCDEHVRALVDEVFSHVREAAERDVKRVEGDEVR